MRILVISNYYPPLELGGWEQLTRDVSVRLVERGHQVHVLTSRHRAHEIQTPEPQVERLLHLESPNYVHYQPQYALTRHWTEMRNRRTVRRTVATHEPDVVFINGMWNLPICVAQQAEQLCPGRVVYYMASYWPTETDAHAAYWNDTDYGKNRAARSGRRWAKELVAKVLRPTLVRTVARNQLEFARVLCVSAFVQRRMVAEAHIPFPRTQVVHNGIELDAFTMPELHDNGLNEGDLRRKGTVLRLLYAGRLSPDKGVHTIIESLGHLKTRKLSVCVSIVGGGAPDYVAQLQQRADELGVAELVHFRGSVPRESMPTIMQEHDVLLFPSAWPEPLARTVQEAMACGLVVIGTTTGGTPEILEDGVNGLTFPAEDSRTLAAKVARLSADPALCECLARAARKTVEDKFSLDQMVGEIERTFEELVHKSRHVAAYT